MHLSRLADIVKIKPDMEGAKNIYKQVPISREVGKAGKIIIQIVG